MNAVNEMAAPLFYRQCGGQGSRIDRGGRQSGTKLRVFVTGGGCSGFQYGFTFDEEVNEDDTTMGKMASPAHRPHEFSIPGRC